MMPAYLPYNLVADARGSGGIGDIRLRDIIPSRNRKMNNEPGMGFLPTVSSPKKRIAPDVVPNPAPAPVVNNFNFFIDPQAATVLQNALMWVDDICARGYRALYPNQVFLAGIVPRGMAGKSTPLNYTNANH